MFVLPVSAELWDGFLLGISILSYISVLSSGYPLFCQVGTLCFVRIQPNPSLVALRNRENVTAVAVQ